MRTLVGMLENYAGKKRVVASIELSLTPKEVLEVFLKHEHLKAWWGISKSLIEPRKGGLYSLVWQNEETCLEYVTTGVITEYLPACQLKIENMVYINPQKSILGPMELLILTTPEENSTHLTVIQSGYQEGIEWNWLYESVKQAWPEVLKQVKNYLESMSPGVSPVKQQSEL